ncbi:Protein phosphatase [Mycena sanguinolenta]|uniref:Protein phosphatase n=1 Tax=Mycena sanguinolenta TaxID=230812 RepID=A0A8H6ZIB8_9AGAR|nr:Protein phosphatase [Mycena sanguinolenta]
MGRRKIEIQPITHERNRSVTFLKRKNGLFKKAYELGVLCSVDVAVIIFEQRPGHNVKLYQYCSGDVNNMVQRHIAFDGERDTRGPADFSGNAATKIDETADGDDDDQDDEDEVLPTLGSKRRSDGSKPGTDLTLNIDQDYRRQGQQRPPVLPVSSDRNSPSSKKPRIAPMLPPSGRGDLPSGFSYARGASGSSSYTSPNTPYYPPMSNQAPFAPPSSFESFSGSRGSQSQRSGLPMPYGEYPPLASTSRPQPHRTTSSGDPFASLLDEEGSRQTHGLAGQNTSYGGIDWPVHTTTTVQVRCQGRQQRAGRETARAEPGTTG